MAVPAKSSFQSTGYPDCAAWGLLPAQAPLPSDTALLQSALHWAQALRELETLHGTHSKPRGLWEGLAVLKQPGFGNIGSQEEDSLLTWTVDPGAFQAWLFDFSLFLSKTFFLLNGVVPPRGHFLVYLQPCHHKVKLQLLFNWKEVLPTYSHRLPFLLQSH